MHTDRDGRFGGPFLWGLCDSCHKPFVIEPRATFLPEHIPQPPDEDWIRRFNAWLQYIRKPYYPETLDIAIQRARRETEGEFGALRQRREQHEEGTAERAEIENATAALLARHRSRWGGLRGDDLDIVGGGINWNDDIHGFEQARLETRRRLLQDPDYGGLSEDELIELERSAFNRGEFDRFARRRLGYQGRRSRQYLHRLDEEENLLGGHHHLSADERGELRRNRQQRLGLDLGFFNILGQKVGHTNERVVGSFIIMIAGLVVSSFMHDMWFFYGFMCWGFYFMLPNAGDVGYSDELLGNYIKEIRREAEGEAAYTVSERPPPVSARLGPLIPYLMFARASTHNKDNAYNTGIAFMKVMMKIAGIILIGIALFRSEVPLSAFVFVVFALWAYYSLPVRYDPEKPEEFMGSIIRFLMGFFVPFMLWQMFNGYGAPAGILFWIPLAFLLVFPVAKAKTEAKALSMAVTAGEAHREMIDKIIFICIMGFTLLIYLGIFDLATGPFGLAGTSATVFWVVFIIGGFSGVLSPSEVRPYTGILVIAITFFLFAAGPGQQAVGAEFLGQWWPAFHNTITAVTGPFGQIFGTLQETFGKTFLLMTNPVAYAHGIMEGSYESSGQAPAGAFGVEIENLQIPAIYPGTQSIMTFNVHNIGPVKARKVTVTVKVSDEFKDVVAVRGPDGGENYNITKSGEMGLNSIVPVFYTLDATGACEKIKDNENLRKMYIRVNVSINYEYDVSSWLPVTIINEQEWKNRITAGTFSVSTVPSHISTSPAKLSIGSFDQPFVSTAQARPFYIGFNLTTAEGPQSRVNVASVELSYPREFGIPQSCYPSQGTPPLAEDTYRLSWNFADKAAKQAFCMFSKTPDPGAPSKTYYVRAKSSFGFSKWETRDTLWAFGDVCEQSISAVAGGQLQAVPGFVAASMGTSSIPSKADYCATRPAPRNYHYGYDYSAPAGTTVKAVYPGKVVWVGNWDPAEAVWVKSSLSDGRTYVTSYGHVNPSVSAGANVNVGDTVGTIYQDHLDAKMFWYDKDKESGYVDYWTTAFDWYDGTPTATAC